jgi:hypothetical protein
MKTPILAALVFAASMPAMADHLYPEPSVLGGDLFLPGYQNDVAIVLKEALDSDVVLRMIALPSFVPEQAVAMRQRHGAYEIFALRPSEPVWGYRGRHPGKNGNIQIRPDGDLDFSGAALAGTPAIGTIPLSKCVVTIPTDLAEKLSMAWEHALMQVRFDSKQDMGADGADFHFAMRKGHAFLAGQVWSPALSSDTGQLVALADAMAGYCIGKSPDKLADLRRRLSFITAPY